MCCPLILKMCQPLSLYQSLYSVLHEKCFCGMDTLWLYTVYDGIDFIMYFQPNENWICGKCAGLWSWKCVRHWVYTSLSTLFGQLAIVEILWVQLVEFVEMVIFRDTLWLYTVNVMPFDFENVLATEFILVSLLCFANLPLLRFCEFN